MSGGICNNLIIQLTINHNFMGKKYKQGDRNFVGVAQKCQY